MATVTPVEPAGPSVDGAGCVWAGPAPRPAPPTWLSWAPRRTPWREGAAIIPPGSAPVPLVEVDHVRGLDPAMGRHRIDATAAWAAVSPTAAQDTSGRAGRGRLGLLRAVAAWRGGRAGRPRTQPHRVVAPGHRSSRLGLAGAGRDPRIGFDGQFCLPCNAGCSERESRVRLRPVLATVYAGNAVAATVPFAGSQMSVVFVFRRFRQMGVEATVAGWTLAVAGRVTSPAAFGMGDGGGRGLRELAGRLSAFWPPASPRWAVGCRGGACSLPTGLAPLAGSLSE